MIDDNSTLTDEETYNALMTAARAFLKSGLAWADEFNREAASAAAAGVAKGLAQPVLTINFADSGVSLYVVDTGVADGERVSMQLFKMRGSKIQPSQMN